MRELRALIWDVVAMVLFLWSVLSVLSGCGTAPTEDLMLPCGTHPERPGSTIYCVCVLDCPGQHQCTLYTGECDPYAKALDCEQITGYSEKSEDMWELAQSRPCGGNEQ